MGPEPFEVVAGDALQVADVKKALTGCDAVHVSIDHDQEGECVTQVLEAARAQGLQRITYISGVTVCEENRWFPLVDRKLRSERAIRASGIDYTIFRSTPYWMLRLIARLSRNTRMRVGIEMVKYLEKVGERGDPTEANAILGAPQVTLDQWLRMRKRGEGPSSGS